MSTMEVHSGQSSSHVRDDTELPQSEQSITERGEVRTIQGGGYAIFDPGRGLQYVPPTQSSSTEDEDAVQESRPSTGLVSRGAPGSGEQFTVLAQWEGVVQQIEEDGTLWVRLTSGPERPEEVSDFSIEEVPPVDRPLVRTGAVFYWTIGYRDQADGQRTRESSIRFRRLPNRRMEDVEEARSWAAETMDLLRLGASSESETA